MDRVPPAGDRPEVQRASLAPSRSGGVESKATKGGKAGGIMYTVYSKGGRKRGVRGLMQGLRRVRNALSRGCRKGGQDEQGKREGDRGRHGGGTVAFGGDDRGGPDREGVARQRRGGGGGPISENVRPRGGGKLGRGGDERRPDGSPERNVFRHPPAVEDGNGNAPRPSRSRLVHREAGYEDREGRQAGDQGIEGHV